MNPMIIRLVKFEMVKERGRFVLFIVKNPRDITRWWMLDDELRRYHGHKTISIRRFHTLKKLNNVKVVMSL